MDRNKSKKHHTNIVGESPAWGRILNDVTALSHAPSTVTVFLTGETGTGKEVIARAIHDTSDRAGRMFIPINCAAIPADLLESVLFGHEKGAFTGAYAKSLGKFEQAEGGTILLDEDDEKGRLALVLDVEQILRLALPARFKGGDEVTQAHDVQIPQGAVILYADDSGVARSQIEKALTHLGLPFIGTKTGKEAWERLQIMAKEAKAAGIPIRNKVAMVLTDLEMPEMDGFTLTRHLKEHDVLKDVPVVIHSSLSGTANESHANSVGANGYVAKFVPDELARAIAKVL